MGMTDEQFNAFIRSILFQAKTARNLEEFNLYLESVASQENVAIVKEQLAKMNK